MTGLTRRQAIGTMGAAAAFAAGLGRPVFGDTAAGSAGIDQVLTEAVKSGKAPGVVALAANDKATIYSGAFGVRNLAQPQAMTLDSVFWIASMTKAVTTAAAMQMVEQGKLKLDQPASEILPDLASAQVLEGFDAVGTPQLRPVKRPITLRQLLTHTAGYTYDIWNENTGRYEKQANLPKLITCKDDALKTPLAFDPGDRWEYGINIDFAGKMVEKVSGERLESYFHEHIFGPLGMADTSFRLSPSQRERLVGMHSRGDDGALKPIEFEMPQEPEFFMGGGGLYSTGPDYLKFVRMFLNRGSLDGKTLLQPETVATMEQNQIGNTNVTALKSVIPGSSRDAEFFPGIVKKWGLGFMINTETAPTGRSAGSLAWAGLANTYFWIDPSKNITGVILMQFLPFADPQALQTFAEFESRLYKVA
ncbi:MULTISPECIES: serine hydrolase domain-containing protein [unclassified Bradyrhizobium]|uniref:serine hydrolase domain-containing protein n=1 Tax=unclassified Bradyrhizobium TaxID=2631580 RepID=UPI0024B25449|nr:serine hydrolase domain-containing protein [Bradyrhizobium sp. CB2312]WFU75253.1 serine hydrolase [Bradyrhizobium sp. CB2312]